VEDNLGSVQTQLLQSEKLASIGQLAAGVAHEINNPVGFISNNMEVLQEYVGNYTKILRVIEQIKIQMDSGDMEKVKATIIELKKLEEDINLDYMMSDVNKLLEQSSRGLERIRKIVLDLKTFAREDKTEATELIKVEEVIDSILSIVQSEIKYKAELIKEYGNTPLIKGSAQRLGQVFINLLVNASHAIEDRGKIIIKTYQKDQYVCINVTDTGKGIASEDMKKIFDPFFTTKPVGQGTGLGLSVSYEIVKKHGGEIRVESKIGEGTTFMVMLPINNEGRS
jgi:signal transduction histidine kinase